MPRGRHAPQVDPDPIGNGHIQDRKRDRQPASRFDHAIQEAAFGPLVALHIAEDAVLLGKALDEQPQCVGIAPRAGDRAGKLAGPLVNPLERGAEIESGLSIAQVPAPPRSNRRPPAA